MSTYSRITKNPKTGEFEVARWMDDYFAHRHYGVRFPDGSIVDPRKVELETKPWEEEKKTPIATFERVVIDDQVRVDLVEVHECKQSIDNVKPSVNRNTNTQKWFDKRKKPVLTERERFIEIINDYSSSKGRAKSEHQEGISKGIEMFRSYLLENV